MNKFKKIIIAILMLGTFSSVSINSASAYENYNSSEYYLESYNNVTEENNSVVEESPFSSEVAEQIFNELNVYRNYYGLNSLSLNESLGSGTETRAVEFATKVMYGYSNPFDLHYRLNGEYWLTAFNGFNVLAENLSYSTDGAEGMMSFWKSSASHNAAMLNPYYTSVSIKVYYYNGVYYGVQIFS